MSVQSITWAIEQNINSSSQKLVLICLANYANSEGFCFPGQKRLARDASMSDRSVRTALSGLEAKGYIIRSRRQREDGTRTSDEYQLMTNRKDLPQGEEATGRNTSNLPEETRQAYRKNFPGNEPVRGTVSNTLDKSMSISPNEAVEIWNEICVPAGMAKPRANMPARRIAALKARLKAEGLDGWRQGCERLAASSFCRGENNTGWKADIDFLAGESGFAKVMEGKYDDTTGPGAGNSNTARHRSAFADALSEFGESGRGDTRLEYDASLSHAHIGFEGETR